MSRQRSRELIEEVRSALAEFASEEMAKGGADAAQRLAQRFADWLTDCWGGQQLYFPMDLARRNARIYEEFTGGNHAELAEKYHMSVNTVYAILRDERARRQPGLFDFEAESSL
ncbi:Mor transcription activator family protein [Telmatospirillum sp. J64-1]|uniref:Mor transcription activator family protein n=1 Tax=Telmatospirillum sp. J64-1 TaxID=2502183 RepID=UPI00115D16B3|nr:Mor transcription activator family protein [Telmatospirillum sp. J64-1]